jgi:integrase
VEIVGRGSASGAETWIDLRADATEADYDYRWVIKHGPEDYKTGRNYGERPPMVIAPSLYGAMEEWIEHRRAHLAPRHDYLFTARNGAPLTDVGVHSLLTSTSYRLTGRRVNPHLVRDMIITHLRGTDASERQLEALAIYMGHSLAMQKGTYDRRSKAEKVAPAVELLSSLNGELARG